VRLAIISALALAAALALLWTPTADAQPEPTLVFPKDGDVLAEPPPIIRMCFDSPVNIQDLDAGGDFRFAVITPESRGLGLRIVFRPDGLGVDVHRGLPEGTLEGEWTFEWRVTDPETLEPAEGTVKFTVSPDGSPVPEEPPEPCVTDNTPSPSPTSAPTATPAADEGNDGPDAIFLGLVIGVPIAAVALGLVLLLLIRRRRGSPAG